MATSLMKRSFGVASGFNISQDDGSGLEPAKTWKMGGLGTSTAPKSRLGIAPQARKEAEGRLNEGRCPGRLQAPRASTRRRPKADVVKVRPGLIDEWPGLPGLRLAKMWIFKNGLIGTLTAPNDVPSSSPSGKFRAGAKYGPTGNRAAGVKGGRRPTLSVILGWAPSGAQPKIMQGGRRPT